MSSQGHRDAWPGAARALLEYFLLPQRQPLTFMTRKQWILIALAVVLGGFSLYLNKDWFGSENIQIHHRSRPGRAFSFRRRRPLPQSATEPVFFAFNRKLKLTSVKVIPLSAIATNKYPQPIWHLVSESNSIPVETLAYGVPIRGMHPAIKGAAADPLEPGVTYRLLIEAGKLKAQDDFTAVASPP